MADINEFLKSLNAQPPPPPPGTKRPKSHQQTQADELAAVREVEAMKPPGEASELDTRSMECRTWEKKRIMLNEPGIANAVAQIKTLPEPGESYHAIMGGDFHGFDIIPSIQRLAAVPLMDMRIATYSFSLKNILQMCKMIDTGLIAGSPVELVVSIFFAKTDGNVFAKCKAEIEARGGKLAITRNHAKVIGCQLGDTENFIVCETSANLRSCLSLEQFTLVNSRELYHFHRKWIEHIASNPE
jgi:DNA-binding transcriptional regulator YiaG